MESGAERLRIFWIGSSEDASCFYLDRKDDPRSPPDRSQQIDADMALQLCAPEVLDVASIMLLDGPQAVRDTPKVDQLQTINAVVVTTPLYDDFKNTVYQLRGKRHSAWTRFKSAAKRWVRQQKERIHDLKF